jgi:4-amino-4-deoxy-L-arabinose transferase-like glycosyltransferase
VTDLPNTLRAISDRIRTSPFPARLVTLWEMLSRCAPPLVIIVGGWALLCMPLVFLRGFNSDEGLAVTIARAAVEDGYWLTCHEFNIRFVERPTLLSWIIGAFSLPFGHVNQFTARFPVALFLLGGCLLIYLLSRRVGASLAAALLAVALFLACPIVLRTNVMTTADMPLAVLLFLAFILWWIGYERGAITLERWCAIGGVLALAALLKGPEPIAYFAFGIGLFILWTRAWRQIPGFVLAGVICIIPTVAWYVWVFQPGDQAQWLRFMRLVPSMARLHGPLKELPGFIGETLPLVLVAGLAFWTKGFRTNEKLPAGFIKAAGCYALTASFVILFWPGGSTGRYFYPMFLPVAVIGGLCYDALAARRPWLLTPGLVVTFALLAYGLVYSMVAAPLMPWQFRSTALYGAQITKLMRADPAPLLITQGVGLNVMPYVPGRIVKTDLQALEKIGGPAWFGVHQNQAQPLLAKRPDKLRDVLTFGRYHQFRLLHLEK